MGDSRDRRRRRRIKTLQQSPSAADLSVSLPPDVITEILIRLPVRSILRFKSVCKSWYALFSDPIFVEKHLEASTQNKDYANHRLIINSIYSMDVASCSIPSVLHQEHSTAVHPLDYPSRSSDPEVWIVGSVNGLVLIMVDKVGVFLWNPATRESKRLPPTGFEKDNDVKITAYEFGFGFDKSSSDYKVFLIKTDITRLDHRFKNEAKIYGLKSNSWGTIENVPDCHLLGHSGRFVSGALHWPVSFGTRVANNWEILAFNLSENTFSAISHPFLGETSSKLSNAYFSGRYLDSMIGVLDDCLCLLPMFDGTNIDVWVMKEYGKMESWSKMFSIAFPYDPDSLMYSIPVFISRKNEVLLMVGIRLVLCNLERDSVTYLVIEDFFKTEINTYIETLVSP